MSYTFPTRSGRWGIRQIDADGEVSGGTVFCGWPTRADALAANPPVGDWTHEAFDRWPDLPEEGDR